MTEYTKTIVSALSSRNSDYSDPHVLLREATQTGTDEIVFRKEGRLENHSTIGTSSSYKGFDYIYLSQAGMSDVNTFILHNRSSHQLHLRTYVTLADLSSTITGVCTFSGNNQIDCATSGGFTKGEGGFDGSAFYPTHVNTYGAKSSNNNDFATLATLTDGAGTLDRLTVDGTPFGTNEAENAGGHTTTLRLQFLEKVSFYIPAGSLFSFPGQVRKIIGNLTEPEIAISAGYTADNSKTLVTEAIDYTLFMAGTNS
tara:strand:+ start:471 stop:1238 length:768 start_codon:yes stop_codon:yes gene_type:complete